MQYEFTEKEITILLLALTNLSVRDAEDQSVVDLLRKIENPPNIGSPLTPKQMALGSTRLGDWSWLNNSLPADARRSDVGWTEVWYEHFPKYRPKSE